MTELTGTRRDVLRAGTGAIGAATIASSAGCMGFIGGGGDYAQWLPEPGTFVDGNHYRFDVFKLESLAENEDEFSDGRTNFESSEERWAPADIDWEDVTMHLRFEGVAVVEADFEQEAILEDYEDGDYDEAAEHEGYTLVSSPEERAMVGVGSDALVIAGDGYYGDVEDPREAVETVIDTNDGDEPRYADESEAFAELNGQLGDGDIVRGGTHALVEEGDPERGWFENQVAVGSRISVTGEESDGEWVVVYEEEDDVDVDDVEDWVEASQESNGEFAGWGDVEVSKNGRTAVVTATADTDDL